MKTLAILSRKGGTGKTTLAVNLSVAAERAGHSTVLVDLDPQASAVKWNDNRKDDAPVVVASPVSRLPEVLKKAEAAGATLAILDTAPHTILDTNPYTRADALDIAGVAEMALIPCKPALIDLQAITSTINVIRLANVPARIVFNAVPSRGNRADQARTAVEVFDVPCAPCKVGDRVAFMDAYNAGLTVQEYEPRGESESRSQRFCMLIYQAKWGCSMPRKTNLAEAFKVNENELQPKPELEVVESPPEKATKPKKRHIGGYFDEAVYRQLKIVGAGKGTDNAGHPHRSVECVLPDTR